ncbi:CLC_0170 family protein [Clostridium sp. DL1XJH146]
MELFDKYLVLLVVILGLIVGVHDSKGFKNSKLESEYKLAKYIGLSMVGVVLIMFIVRAIVI